MLQAWALEGIPEVSPGDDLVALIADAVAHGVPLADGDIVVVTSKIVSKAEGRILHAHWTETGVPGVRPPTRSGFGSQLFEMFPKIKATRTFAADGVKVKAEVPLIKSPIDMPVS